MLQWYWFNGNDVAKEIDYIDVVIQYLGFFKWQILSNEIHFPVLLMGRSLEMLVDVNLAEEGILRLLFAAVYLMFNKSGNDSETSAASR